VSAFFNSARLYCSRLRGSFNGTTSFIPIE
jgi:hypothetical protein